MQTIAKGDWMDLNKLLRPKKIAIIGASDNENFGGLTTKIAIENSHVRLDDLYLINPKRKKISQRPCFRSINEVGEKIDLAVICTPKENVEDILKEAAIAGVKGAVVYASGYSETGTIEGVELENRLVTLCKQLDIALMGPNCAGFINFMDRVFAFGIPMKSRPSGGKVGLVSQSGAICVSLLDDVKTNYSYVISCGNSKVVSIEDYIEFLVEDNKTMVVATYIEGIGNPNKFVQVLKKAAKKRKPVVVLKTGRTKKGEKAAASHTGNLTGADQAYDAIFEKYGVIRVSDMAELSAVSMVLAAMPVLPRKNAFGAISISGGETAITADVSESYGLQYPDLHTDTIKRLTAILPDFATPSNPLDATGAICYDPVIYESVLHAILDDPGIEMLIICFTLVEQPEDPAIYYMVQGIERYMCADNVKPIVMIPFIESGRNMEILKRLSAVNLPILPTSQYGYKVLQYILKYSQYDINKVTPSIPSFKDFKGQKVVCSEHRSKKILKKIGVRISKEALAQSETEAVRHAKRIGFPVVLKIDSSEILHKSDAGGVILDINSAPEVKKAYHTILKRVALNNPTAEINGILVQEMLPKGLEVIVGIYNDRQFGPIVLLGLGGVYVEIYKDTVNYPAPFSLHEAHQMITRLKAKELFFGYRNGPNLDVDALAETLVTISEFAVTNQRRLVEMDINPLFVYPQGKGVAVGDALIIQYESSSHSGNST
jgi:acyl-CoA synthetase (NDP forming)